MSQFLSSWGFNLFIAVNLVAATTLYVMGTHRVNVRAVRHADRWPRWKSTCFLAGVAALALVYLGPIDAWSHTFFWAHMTQHLVVTMAAAPLLVLGDPITVAFRASGPVNRRRIVRALRTRTVRILTDPLLTWLLFAAMLLSFHFTGFYDWVLANHGAMVLVEQPAFLIIAFLYYLPLIGSNLLPHRPSHAKRLISLALMMMPEATIGAVIYFSPVVLYDGYDNARPFGLAALPDQQLSGAIMWGLVMVIDSFWMMWVAADWFSSEERRSRREDAERAREAAITP